MDADRDENAMRRQRNRYTEGRGPSKEIRVMVPSAKECRELLATTVS